MKLFLTFEGKLFSSFSIFTSVSAAKAIISLVSGHSVEKETLSTATNRRRGRKKLYKTAASSPLLDSPLMVRHRACASVCEEHSNLECEDILKANTSLFSLDVSRNEEREIFHHEDI